MNLREIIRLIKVAKKEGKDTIVVKGIKQITKNKLHEMRYRVTLCISYIDGVSKSHTEIKFDNLTEDDLFFAPKS